MQDPYEITLQDLAPREQGIRSVLSKHKVTLVPGQGLQLALDEVQALTSKPRSADKLSEEEAIESGEFAAVIWSLSATLETCLNAGLPLANHLRQITTGTVDYGIPAGTNESKRSSSKISNLSCSLPLSAFALAFQWSSTNSPTIHLGTCSLKGCESR